MKKILVLGLAIGAPLLALAAGGETGNVGSIINIVAGWIYIIVPVLVTLAIAYFIWGVISFMTTSDEAKKKEGRSKIINGLIGLFVILAFWGIIAVVKNTFGIYGGSNEDEDAIVQPGY